VFHQEMNTVLSFLDGAKAILLMGRDGIVIERYEKKHEDNLEEVSIEISQMLFQAAQTIADQDFGELKELSFLTSKHILLIHLLSDDAFLALLMAQDEKVGKAKFALQKISSRISSKISI